MSYKTTRERIFKLTGPISSFYFSCKTKKNFPNNFKITIILLNFLGGQFSRAGLDVQFDRFLPFAVSHFFKLHNFFFVISISIFFRVLNVLKKWVDSYFYDLENDVELINKINEFLDSIPGKSMKKWVVCIKTILQRKVSSNLFHHFISFDG